MVIEEVEDEESADEEIVVEEVRSQGHLRIKQHFG